MSAEFSNVYDDQARADSYARLEFPGAYYLAYRNQPDFEQATLTGVSQRPWVLALLLTLLMSDLLGY